MEGFWRNLGIGLTLLGMAGHAPAQGLRYETDPFRHIPLGSYPVYTIDIDGDGGPDIYWWDRNRDWAMQDDELFFDLNEDGIPDLGYADLKEIAEDKHENERDGLPKSVG